MTFFEYHVTNKDSQGLANIFLQKARAEGFEGTVKNWNAVLSVFKDIQQEELEEGDKLYSGGSDAKDWHKNFLIKPGDVIKITQEQLQRIYKAMGFEKPEAPPASNDDLPADESTETEEPAPENTVSRFSVNTVDAEEKAEQGLQAIFSKEQATYSEVKKAFEAIPPALTAYVVNNYDGITDQIKALSPTPQQTLAADKLLNQLIQRAKELGINTKGMNPLGADLDTRLTNIQKLSAQIIEKENDTGTIQTVFDKAADFIQKFISMEPKPEIIFQKNDYSGNKTAAVKFADGGFINVVYDYQGKISSIAVSYERNESDMGDTAEVLYKSDGAYYANNKHKLRNKITEGYDFTVLQETLGQILAAEEARQSYEK